MERISPAPVSFEARHRYLPSIDSVVIAESLPVSVHQFYEKTMPIIAVVSTEDEYLAEIDENAVVFGTHSGKFHTDEALGLAIRCMMLENPHKIIIIRSRDPAMLDKCSELFDVGHIYDPEKGLFDHHQKDFNECFFQDTKNEDKTFMATSGLVYKHWGKRMIASLYPEAAASDPLLHELYNELYTDFVEAIDASDNGFSIMPRGVRPRYRITTAIQSQVGGLNQPLMSLGDPALSISQNKRFLFAMLITLRPFLVTLDNKIQKIRLAAPIVSSALLKCVERGDQILVLSSPCPWKKMLNRLETDANLNERDAPLLCVAPSDGSAYMIMTIPVDANKYYLGSRMRLPESWAGKQKQELSNITGIDQCIFCHRGQFIAGNETLDGAIAMAKKAIKINTELSAESSVKEILEISRLAQNERKRSRIEPMEKTGQGVDNEAVDEVETTEEKSSTTPVATAPPKRVLPPPDEGFTQDDYGN